MFSSFRVRGISVAISVYCASLASAQTAQPVEPIVVTGNPFGSSIAGRAETVLEGDALASRLRSTLGETLASLPGVSSSYFGPTASRPIIRGLDGERVRILENGASSLDAASLSPDHAVPIEPLTISRIEVLRGPAALLYGSNAIGGVVNTVSKRIPRAATARPEFDVSLGGASGDQSRSAAASGQSDAKDLAVHLDASTRTNADVGTPKFQFEGQTRDHIANSAAQVNSAALGLSRIWTDGYLGASVDHYDSHYGVVASDDVTIDMRRTRVNVEGSHRYAPTAMIAEVSGQATYTKYRHAEIEGSGAVGTRFANMGGQWRLDAKTRPLGAWRAIFGVSGEDCRFSALGEEAFVPPNRTQNYAAFGLTQWKDGPSEINVGARIEQARVSTDVVINNVGVARFGAAQNKRDTLFNGAFSIAHTFASHWIARGSLSHTERAPTYFERFADGVHVATAAYERGDAQLRPEQAVHAELGLAWKRDHERASFNVFSTQFNRFISLTSTKKVVAIDDSQSVPVYEFQAIPAHFVGFEFDSSHRIITNGNRLDFTTRWDVTRATQRDTGISLPRIAPMRIGAGLAWFKQRWFASANALHAFAQTRLPDVQTEKITPAYTLLNAAVGTSFLWGSHGSGKLTLRANNLANALALNASSLPHVRERAPLPGRSISLTLDLFL